MMAVAASKGWVITGLVVTLAGSLVMKIDYDNKMSAIQERETASRAFLEEQKEITAQAAGEAPVTNHDKPGYAQDRFAFPGDTSSDGLPPRDPGRYSSLQEFWNGSRWTRASLCFGDPEDQWESWKYSVRNVGRHEFVAFVEAKCEGP